MPSTSEVRPTVRGRPPTPSAAPPPGRARSATPLAEVTFCVLDLETTGTDPAWDDITEVGAILVRGGERLGTFHTLVGPGCAGIDGVLPSLLGFVGDAVITGHNISFDIRFLNAALARADRPPLVDGDVVDTMYLARALLRDDVDDCRLGTLAARFDFEHRPSHRAFEDAAATVDLLHLLIERSSSFGVVGLDDLCAVPSLARHRWAAKLRHTAGLPRVPGVFTCHDEHGRVVWVGAADDLRRDVRSLFVASGSAVHASVLRDTHTWQAHHVAAPLAREATRLRLLHRHRPPLQRRSVVADTAAYVCIDWTGRGLRTTVVREPRATGHHLGPLPRTSAAEARAALHRLVAAGVDLAELVPDLVTGPVTEPSTGPVGGSHDAPGLAAAWDELRAAATGDAVALALVERDRRALEHATWHHGRIARARSFSGTLRSAGHPVVIAHGVVVDEHLPVAVDVPSPDQPLPAHLLAEVTAVAAALDTGPI